MADLYLNEFPIGGSSSVCEAISQGCPVVARYYPESELIAMRSGAYFMGNEPYIETTEEYVNTAIRLLKDESFRREWQEKSKKRSQYINDLERYSNTHQKIIAEFLEV